MLWFLTCIHLFHNLSFEFFSLFSFVFDFILNPGTNPEPDPETEKFLPIPVPVPLRQKFHVVSVLQHWFLLLRKLYSYLKSQLDAGFKILKF